MAFKLDMMVGLCSSRWPWHKVTMGQQQRKKNQRRIISTSKQVISIKLAEYDGRRDIFVLHDLDCYFQNVYIAWPCTLLCFVRCWWCLLVSLFFSVVVFLVCITQSLLLQQHFLLPFCFCFQWGEARLIAGASSINEDWSDTRHVTGPGGARRNSQPRTYDATQLDVEWNQNI